MFRKPRLPRFRRLLYALLTRRVHTNDEPIIPHLNRHVLRLSVVFGLVDLARAALCADDLASCGGFFGEVGDVLLGDPLGGKLGTVLVHDVLHTGGVRSFLEPGVLTFHTGDWPGKAPDMDNVSCTDLVAGCLDFADQVLVRVSVRWAVWWRSVVTPASVGVGRRVGRRTVWRIVGGVSRSSVLASTGVGVGRRVGRRIVWRIVGGVSGSSVVASTGVSCLRAVCGGIPVGVGRGPAVPASGRWWWMRSWGAGSTGSAAPGKVLVVTRRAFNIGDRGCDGKCGESNEGDERLREHYVVCCGWGEA